MTTMRDCSAQNFGHDVPATQGRGMVTFYRVGTFPRLTAQDVLEVMTAWIDALSAREREILPERLSYLELAGLYYALRELVGGRTEVPAEPVVYELAEE